MSLVTLNESKGTVTMSYAAYKMVHHDSLMLNLLLRVKNVPDGSESLLEEYKQMDGLGEGYKMCQSPMCDEDELRYVFGREYIESD